jgi:hypothetical protein
MSGQRGERQSLCGLCELELRSGRLLSLATHSDYAAHVLFLHPASSAHVHPSLCASAAQIAGWSSFKHFMREENELELSCLDADWRQEQRDFLLHSCLWQQIDPSEIIGTHATLLQFEVGSVTQADVATFTSPFRMDINADAEVSGFGSWFETAFEGAEASPVSHRVVLTTEPPSDTHWGQQARASTRKHAHTRHVTCLTAYLPLSHRSR